MRTLRFVSIALLMLACSRSGNPVGSSMGGDAVHAVWSPYLGIHPFSWHTGVNQPYLAKLMESAPVRGLRFDVDNPAVCDLTSWAKARGAQDFLGIFSNEYLRDPHVTEIFDATVRACPDIGYWEIGNEVGLFIGMSMSEYMPIFLEIYEYAHQRFPELVIIAQPSAGNHDGARDLAEMIEQGLGALARDADESRRLKIVSIHVYGTKDILISKFQRQVASLPITTEVWVTETGINVPGGIGQTQYMLESYPRIRSLLRASRIYWYVFSECSGFAMVRGLPDACIEPIRYSDLYRDLTGGVAP